MVTTFVKLTRTTCILLLLVAWERCAAQVPRAEIPKGKGGEGDIVAPTYAPSSQQMTVIPNQKARNSGTGGGGTVIVYDQRQYHWPMFGRVRFIERDIYRQAQRKMIYTKEEEKENQGNIKKKGFLRKLRERRGK